MWEEGSTILLGHAPKLAPISRSMNRVVTPHKTNGGLGKANV